MDDIYNNNYCRPEIEHSEILFEINEVSMGLLSQKVNPGGIKLCNNCANITTTTNNEELSENSLNLSYPEQFDERNDFYNDFYNNITQRWTEHRMTGKVCFLVSFAYIMAVCVLLLQYPSGVILLYCVAYPLLFGIRIYTYTKSKSFLFLFDNCYFINWFLVLFLWIDLPNSTIFLAIFTAINGPVLIAVLPFRNTLAIHDIDKVTSCFIHCIPPIVSWSIRWFPIRSSVGWFRSFETIDPDLTPIYKWQSVPVDFIWGALVPLSLMFLHDILYMVLIHGIIRPSPIYSDSYTYLKSRKNFIGKTLSRLPTALQSSGFVAFSLVLYVLGTGVAIICYHYWLAHTFLVICQQLVVVWNGGCYYLDYFAYLALKARGSQERTPVVAMCKPANPMDNPNTVNDSYTRPIIIGSEIPVLNVSEN